MKKIFCLIAIIALVSCSSSPTPTPTQHRRSPIIQIGAIGESHRMLVMENGDTLITRSNAAFTALPGDTADYVSNGARWTITIWFAKDRENIGDARKKKDESNTIIVPVMVPRSR